MLKQADSFDFSNLQPHFWDVTARAAWDQDNDIRACAVRLMSAQTEFGLSEDDYLYDFEALRAAINAVTYERVMMGAAVFKKGVSYGSDDCHFIDLPAQLISQGSEAVTRYMCGGEVLSSPVECYGYAVDPELRD